MMVDATQEPDNRMHFHGALLDSCWRGAACSGAAPGGKWCQAKWCWVDSAACKLSSSKSGASIMNAWTWTACVLRTSMLTLPVGFFPNTTKHYYSYETCGNLNSYDHSKFENVPRSVSELRISFPGSSRSGYTIVHDGPPGYKGLDTNNGTMRRIGEFGRLGSTIEYARATDLIMA